MAKLEFKKLFAPALVVTLALLAVNYILSFLKYPVAPLYSVTPVSGITPSAANVLIGSSLGQKVLAWIGGIIPINQFLGQSLVVIFISAYLILLVGTFLVDQFKLPTGKGRTMRIAATILYGTAVFYLIVVGLVMKSWGILLGLAIHTLIVAYVAGWVGDKLGIDI